MRANRSSLIRLVNTVPERLSPAVKKATRGPVTLHSHSIRTCQDMGGFRFFPFSVRDLPLWFALLQVMKQKN